MFHFQVMKSRKCNHCGKRKPVEQMLYQGIKSFCHFDCLYQHSVTHALAKKPSKRKLLEAIKTKSDYLKEAQASFNKYIRMRDIKKGYPCVSCGKPYDGDRYKWDAGHYISRTYSKVRFHLDNVHLQCVKCNRYAGGAPIPYRINLIKRIGEDKVKWLEDHYHDAFKLTSEYLIRLKKIFNKRSRRIEKNAS
jgi:hypothetical protein